jgi:hypothetical protein
LILFFALEDRRDEAGILTITKSSVYKFIAVVCIAFLCVVVGIWLSFRGFENVEDIIDRTYANANRSCFAIVVSRHTSILEGSKYILIKNKFDKIKLPLDRPREHPNVACIFDEFADLNISWNDLNTVSISGTYKKYFTRDRINNIRIIYH